MIMKLTILSILALALTAHAKAPLHLDLEMSGFEYESILDQQMKFYGTDTKRHIFDDIFVTGKRNLDWIRLLNKNRKDRISLSTAETQQGFPINNPRIYNPELIRKSYVNLQSTMPQALAKIIFGTDALPTELPCSVEDYIKWGLEVDRAYQIAARWKMYEPHMDYLLYNSSSDIRGYYFLTTTAGLLERLKDWNRIPATDKADVTLWLNQVCRNDLMDVQQCQTLTDTAIRNNKAFEFFNEHKKAGETILRNMMYIPNDGKFSSVEWTSNTTVEVPFVDPRDQAMRSYLLDNIQEEWRFFPSFSLHVLFVSEPRYGVKVVWQPGVTPHVPGLGANTIYMDANAPISEYDVQWTIRHEFGHVLGFPDCYIEFYDTHLKAIVGYQIDTSDLMCSRRGHLKERHVQEMKRIYQ